LIYLAKANAFAEAHAVLGVLGIPPFVWKEAVDSGETRGLKDPAATRMALEQCHIRKLVLTPPQERAAWALGRDYRLGIGESQVIVMARRRARALLDDARAADVADSMGIQVVSTTDLPVLAVAKGPLDAGRALELLYRLAQSMTIPSDRILWLQTRIKESNP
jgi:predicted nucleic acid-binding protein